MPKINYSNLNDPSINRSVDNSPSKINEPSKNNDNDLYSLYSNYTENDTRKQLDYKNAYKLSFSLSESQRENVFFISDEPIHIDIIGHEEEQALVLLHTNMYIINIKHGDFQWTIKRRYKMFLKLYEEFGLFKTKYNLMHPSENFKVYNSKFKSKDHFQLFFASFANDFNKAKYILEKFLNDVVQHSIFRYNNETLKFFEVSHLSFIYEIGDKIKEGIIQKRSGGYKANMGCCWTMGCCACWHDRWLIVKDSWVGYLNPNTGEIRTVLLVDQGFIVTAGLIETNEKCGLVIENLSRFLHTKCHNENRAFEWRCSISEMLTNRSGKYFSKPQRFDSYAPIRNDSRVKWFVDGADYMESIADAIDAAKEEIFIAGFFMSPEIYLKRPVITGDKYRLDVMLKRKAQEGVKVYILLYKEIELALKINSAYSKRVFTLAHENIKVLRHPDPIKDQLNSILWAHHEKLIIIDQSIAFLGGVDLCFGRWDCFLHRLTDLGSVFPVPKLAHTSHTSNTKKLELSTIMEPAENLAFTADCTIEEGRGPSQNLHFNPIDSKPGCFTIANNSLLRMTSLERFKQPEYQQHDDNDSNFLDDFYTNQTLADIMASDNCLNYKKLKRSKSLGSDDFLKGHSSVSNPDETLNKARLNNRLKSLKESINSKLSTIRRESIELNLINQLQKVREFKASLKRYATQRKHNFDTNSEIDSEEHAASSSSLNVSTIKDADPLLQGSSKLWFGKDYTNFIVKDFDDLESPYRDLIDRNVTHRMPWHDISACVYGYAARDAARHFIQRWNYTKMKKARNNTGFPLLLPKAYDLTDNGQDNKMPDYVLRSHNFSNCRVQCLRSVCNWSAGLSTTESSIHSAIKNMIRKAKHYIYIENQFFISLVSSSLDGTANVSGIKNEIAQCLYERIVNAHMNKEKLKVYVVVPLIPGYEGEYGRASGVTLQTITHYNNLSINRLYKKLSDAQINPRDYICFFSLRTWSILNGKLVTELIYVHSKLLIIDDVECIIGSANINDRSLLGTRDSEFAVHIEDTELYDGLMNKKSVKVGRFCATLRTRLFRELLGELKGNFIKSSKYFNTSEDNLDLICATGLDLSDPCSDDFYERVLLEQASQNTLSYKTVFNVIPCDSISTFDKLKELKRKTPMHISESDKAREELNKVKGYIVLYPNLFLCNEYLKPSMLAKEKLLPSSLWT